MKTQTIRYEPNHNKEPFPWWIYNSDGKVGNCYACLEHAIRFHPDATISGAHVEAWRADIEKLLANRVVK